MSGYLITSKKSECFGCGACQQICPVSAIQMEEDCEGFLYPMVDTARCVNCNLCHKSCPAENPVTLNKPQKALAGFSVQNEIRNHSASGGAFRALVDAVSDNAVVFGVEWQSRNKAVHAKATKEDAYDRFSKSKYVQSIIGSTYREVKSCLDSDQDVLFVGTPCQVAGLCSYLKKEYSNLLCVDLVCHGVPSSKVLLRYFESKDKSGCQVSGIDFREKVRKHQGKVDSKCAKLHFSNGKFRIVDYESSGFLRGFACGLFFRPSCAECPFACAERISDLTIGDAWGIETENPSLNPHEGVSLLLVNTDKGNYEVSCMQDQMILHEVSIEKMVSGNGRLKSPDKGHPSRDVFFRRFESEDFEKLVEEFIPKISLLRRVVHATKRLIRG